MAIMTVLIHTIPYDTHAAAVQVALARKNESSHTWFIGDFPSSQIMGVKFSPDKKTEYSVEDLINYNSIFSEKFDTVWHRRIGALQSPSDSVDPIDWRFVRSEVKSYLSSVIPLIGRDAFWVNGAAESNYADNKLIQLEVAKRVGLKIPETLATNSLDEVKKFLRSGTGSSFVYKPFQARSWTFSDGRELLPYTNKVTEADLPDEALIRACPGIFQPYIEKKAEIRVTIMGHHVVAASVDAVDKTDWRASSETTGLIVKSYTLPDEIESKCLALMKELKLVFGCLDFIVTPEDDYVFLEINEMGQFLWVEYHDPSIKLLDAFSDFLIARDPQFKWTAPRNVMSYSEVTESVEYANIRSKIDAHISQPVHKIDLTKMSH